MLVFFISLSMFKIAIAQNKITIDEDNFYKLAEDKFKNKELYGKFSNTMKKLYETQEGIMLYENFLKTIDDVSMGRTSDYINDKYLIELLDHFCKIVKNAADEENIEEQELFNYLTQKYSIRRRELVIKEISCYFKLADIFDIVFLGADKKSPDKSKNEWISIDIDTGVNPDLINDEYFKQLDVLRPRDIANRNPLALRLILRKRYMAGRIIS